MMPPDRTATVPPVVAPSVADAYRYCRRLTERADSNFALGFRFLPEPKRAAIYALYAFNRCADDFADEGQTDGARGVLLDRWEQALHQCYDGAVEHPVLVAFADAVRRYRIDRQPFLDALAGFRMDLTRNRYETYAELLRYCDLVAGTISTMSLAVFGTTDPAARQYGHDLSMALQLTNILRDVGEDARRNRIYLPLEDLARFGCPEEALLQRTCNEAFRALMRFEVHRARSYFLRAENLVPLLEPDARWTTWLMGAVYAAVLQGIERRRYDVFSARVRLTRTQKAWIVARTWWAPRFL